METSLRVQGRYDRRVHRAEPNRSGEGSLV